MDKKTKTIIGCAIAAIVLPILLVALLTVIGLSAMGRRVPTENTAGNTVTR